MKYQFTISGQVFSEFKCQLCKDEKVPNDDQTGCVAQNYKTNIDGKVNFLVEF